MKHMRKMFRFGYTKRIMKLRIAAAALLLSALVAAAQTLVPADFQVPELYTSRQGTFKLKPLGPKYAAQDYAAYMGSIQHLQKTFTFSTSWPHAGLTMADAIKDVEGEQAAFLARKKFTYAVLNPNESRELGCVYISPSRKQGYDATVRMWVTANQAEIGFDKRLLEEVKAWLQAKWPFERIAYLGHDISREDFQKLPDKPK
jgi:hypothetical protein